LLDAGGEVGEAASACEPGPAQNVARVWVVPGMERLQLLLSGPARFSELRSAIPGITDTMLSQRLKELEDEGLVARDILQNRPIIVQYELTEVGGSLSPILNAIALWSNEWSGS
jgi:DNA-binding HxlR family transcriptional regulator